MVTGVITIVLLAGCGGDDGASSDGAGEERSGTTSIEGQTANDHGSKDVSGMTELALELDDDYFAPTVIEGTPGQKLTLELANEGERPHTFTIADQDLDVVVESGQKGEAKVTFPQSGTVVFTCRFHAGTGMLGGLRAKN